MAEPIVFISTHGIKEGKFDEFRKQYEQGVGYIEAEKPETVAFLAYLNEDENEVSTVHVFADATAMDRHLEGAAERSERAAEYLEFREFEIYGSPSDEALEIMEQAAAGGVSLTVRPQFVGGYLRPHSTRTAA